jgi:uncharacterized protein YdcH (DUF465 family)
MVRACSEANITEEGRMAIAQRSPRDFLMDAEYQRLTEQHEQYEAEIQKIARSSYHSAEDLLEEVRLKKKKLQVKDQMAGVLARIQQAYPSH